MTKDVKRGKELVRAYTDFITSRESMRCTPKTIAHYRYSAGGFVDWLQQQGVNGPAEIGGGHPRQYLSSVRERGVKDTTLHAHARGIKTMLRFLYDEGYLPAPVPVKMPRLDKKRMPYLEADEVQRLVEAASSPRDRALIMVLADSGLRLEESCALRWGDLDIKSGLLEVRRGKGGKARTAVVGEATRATLREYRRWWVQTYGGMPEATDPVWANARTGEPLTGSGVSSAIRRLARTAGVKASPHMFRRTFATLSLRAGMSPFHLQALLGHSTLEMTRRYVQLLDDDLRKAHDEYGPVDHLLVSGRQKRTRHQSGRGPSRRDAE